MPFKSKSQQRFFFAAEAKGEFPKGTARRWAHETPSIKRLPDKVRKRKKTAALLKAAEGLVKSAGPLPGVGTELGKGSPTTGGANPYGVIKSIPKLTPYDHARAAETAATPHAGMGGGMLHNMAPMTPQTHQYPFVVGQNHEQSMQVPSYRNTQTEAATRAKGQDPYAEINNSPAGQRVRAETEQQVNATGPSADNPWGEWHQPSGSAAPPPSPGASPTPMPSPSPAPSQVAASPQTPPEPSPQPPPAQPRYSGEATSNSLAADAGPPMGEPSPAPVAKTPAAPPAVDTAAATPSAYPPELPPTGDLAAFHGADATMRPPEASAPAPPATAAAPPSPTKPPGRYQHQIDQLQSRMGTLSPAAAANAQSQIHRLTSLQSQAPPTSGAGAYNAGRYQQQADAYTSGRDIPSMASLGGRWKDPNAAKQPLVAKTPTLAPRQDMGDELLQNRLRETTDPGTLGALRSRMPAPWMPKKAELLKAADGLSSASSNLASLRSSPSIGMAANAISGGSLGPGLNRSSGAGLGGPSLSGAGMGGPTIAPKPAAGSSIIQNLPMSKSPMGNGGNIKQNLPMQTPSMPPMSTGGSAMQLLKAGGINPGQMQQQKLQQQQQQAAARQMPTIKKQAPPPGQPPGGFGQGGYQGAANALGPPVLSGKLGNGPGVNMAAGGQLGGGIKVGALLKAAVGLMPSINGAGTPPPAGAGKPITDKQPMASVTSSPATSGFAGTPAPKAAPLKPISGGMHVR